MRSRKTDDWLNWTRSKLLRPVSEHDFQGQQRTTILYEGLGQQFISLTGYREVILDYLNENAIGVKDIGPKYDLAIHVRRGDFVISGDHGRQNIQVPTEWYRDAWEMARSALGTSNPRTILFTDGDPKLVQNELGLPNIEIDQSSNAIASMLRIAQADILIGSRSTFSLWGNFLRGGHAIWPKEFNLGEFKLVDIDKDLFL